MKLKDYIIVSKRDVITETYKRTDSKYARACEDYLERKGLAPLYIDKKFPLLNVYANFAFYSGCLARKNVHISENEEMLELVESKVSKRLGMKTKIIPEHKGHGATLVLTEGGPYLSRLLETMGLPRSSGPKAKLKSLEIPHYRKDLFKLASCDNVLDEGDKEIARKLERDSTAVLLSTKMIPLSKKHWVLYTFSRPTEEDAKEFARESVEMIKFSVPGLEIPHENIKVKKLRSGTYSPRIIINGRNTEFVLDANRDLLKFSPELQKLYGFELDFEPVEIF